jgi:two-component system, OmpR family, phosphate regulon sensor histidine kinase PhoR
VSMSDVILTTLAALRPQIDDGGIEVTYDRPPEGAEGTEGADRLRGDRDQLIQVFHNLIENAIKYGATGREVRIEQRLLPSAPGLVGPVLELRVIDSGEGIDPVHLPRLTERFYRVDTHRSRERGGTGLGLAIVKHIVNRHRGRLLVGSVPGQGTTITVQLPTQ